MHTGEQETPTGASRFLLTVAVWVVGLFGLMRIGWVQQNLLLPFAHLQQRIGAELLGGPANAVFVDLSCTGADAMALCLGVVLAGPRGWSYRLRGGALGLALISAVNTLRIATLSLVVGRPALFDALHYYVWPTLLIVAVVGYVYFWTTRGAEQTTGGATPAAATGAGRGSPAWAGRFLLLTATFVAFYFAIAQQLFSSPALHTAGVWTALTAATIMGSLGATAVASGNFLSTAHGSFVVTPECLATPLIPVYAAAALAVPMAPARRAAALLAAPLAFFALGTARLLVLALPAAIVPSHLAAIHAFSQFLAAAAIVAVAAYSRTPGARDHQELAPSPEHRAHRRAAVAMAGGALLALTAGGVWGAAIGAPARLAQSLMGHVGHAYADPQGALSMLPAFQLGLYLALWIAISSPPAWRRLALGLALLGVSQAVLVFFLGELHNHVGMSLHTSLLRAWTLAAPLALIALLERPLSGTVPRPRFKRLSLGQPW